MARRKIVSKKKKPLIVICTEGGKKSSEYLYFRHFASRDLRIQFSSGNSTDPEGMLEDLINYINNEDIKSEDECKIFLVIDTDLNENRIKKIEEIIPKCQKYNIEVITSAPTFEIWYLMHYRKNKLKFSTSQDVKKELEKINGIYKENMDMYQSIIEMLEEAKKTALNIEQKAKNDNKDLFRSNPHTSIYKIIVAIEKYKNNK